MKLIELLEKTKVISGTADLNIEISDIVYDSRQVSAGDVFVAIEGFETDGHKYISQAVSKGAVAVVCQHKPEESVPYVLVEDSRKALASMAAGYFGNPSERMKIIGVTGTNGKTTSTILLKQVLEKCKGAKVGLIGTNENMIGHAKIQTEHTTPESYDLQKLFGEMADSGCEYVVMEVSSHSLVLSRVHDVQFEIGMFTNLSQDHLDFHGDMEAYAKAKVMLFSQCNNAVINLDDEHGKMMMDSAKCPVTTYAIDNNDADIVAKGVKLKSDRVVFSALEVGEIERAEIRIPGRFSAYNALGVIACARLMGISLSDATQALASARGVMGRVEVVETGKPYTVIIDYAHTPDALENVLSAAKGFAPGRVVVLFGCGGDRDAKKRPIMGEIAARVADFVIVTSDNPRTENPGEIISDILEGMKEYPDSYTVIEDRRQAIAYALDNALPDDIIILAGKGHETYQIIGKMKYHMDEREIVMDHLSSGQ